MADTDRWVARFDTDGSGDWEVELPTGASREDLLALAPVVDEIRTFLRPTIDDAA